MTTFGAGPPLRRTLAPHLRIRRRSAWQRRYARVSERAAGDLVRFATMSDSAARKRALDARLSTLREALYRSPHYLEVLRGAGLSPRDLASLDALRHFPFLDRQTLQDRHRELPALDFDSPETLESVFVQSSGSTGDPVPILRDPYDCLHMWSVLRFFCSYLQVELPRRPRVVLLCSLTNGIEYSVRLPLLNDGALHRISLARERPLERLRKARPDVLFSDPAGLHWLAAQMEPPRPRLVLTSAQHFSSEQRMGFGSVVSSPVVNYYATTDVGPIAWECLAAGGRLHVLLPDVWVEAVAGELVVTRLRPSVLPLLRLRTGDHGGVVPEDCRCGYRGFSILDFSGRRRCDFLAPDGRRVDAWRLAWLFKHYPLRGFRLTQRGAQDFGLELEPQSGPARNAEARIPSSDSDLVLRLEQALRLLGFETPVIEARAVDSVSSTGDKPEPFRCALD